MLNFTPSAETFFPELSFPERLRKLAMAGFKNYEMWSWWNKDVEAVMKMERLYGIKAAACCTRFVSLVDRNEHDNYCDGLSETLKFCKSHEIKLIISQVGNEISSLSREEQRGNILAGLRKAAGLLEGSGIKVVIEPLNVLDHPGYYLSSSDETASLIRELGSENIGMLFDIYHQQVSEGNIIARIKEHAALIAHYHIADVPGRHEPGSGELNYRNILEAIVGTGYDDSVGLEFFPSCPDHVSVLESFLSVYGR